MSRQTSPTQCAGHNIDICLIFLVHLVPAGATTCAFSFDFQPVVSDSGHRFPAVSLEPVPGLPTEEEKLEICQILAR